MSPVVPARTITLSLTLALSGTVMMVMGMLVMVDWPAKIGMHTRTGLLFGIPLCAMGQFLYAVAADFLFPDADPRVTGTFELAPWIVMAAAFVGVLI
jgi:hypothetical protein